MCLTQRQHDCIAKSKVMHQMLISFWQPIFSYSVSGNIDGGKPLIRTYKMLRAKVQAASTRKYAIIVIYFLMLLLLIAMQLKSERFSFLSFWHRPQVAILSCWKRVDEKKISTTEMKASSGKMPTVMAILVRLSSDQQTPSVPIL